MVAFELRQVKVWPGSLLQERPCVMKEVEAEVEKRPRHRLAVDHEVLLGQMPAPRPHHQDGRLLVEGVVFAFGAHVIDRAAHGVPEIELAHQIVGPGRRIGVFEVGHEHAGARIQGVDHRLAVDRSGDLDPPVHEIRRGCGDDPISLANCRCLGQKIRQPATVELGLHTHPLFQESASAAVEGAMQLGDEPQGLGRQDLIALIGHGRPHLDTLHLFQARGRHRYAP